MKNQKGQSLLETAIVFPMILMLLSGVLDLGRAFFTYAAMEDAVGDGAFYFSAFPGDVQEAENRVLSFNNDDTFVNLLSDLDNSAVTLSCYNLETKEPLDCAEAKALDVVKIDMSYEYKLLAPFILELNGSPTITLHSTATQIITGR